MIAVRTFFMGKPLEENASPEKEEQEFFTADLKQNVLEDSARG